MGRYIKKHKRQFAGVAFPLLFFIILGATGLSIFPGWLKPSYGTVGDICNFTGSSTCNACAGEFCDVINTMCTISANGTTNPIVQCPTLSFFFVNMNDTPMSTFQTFPLCWDACSNSFDSTQGQNIPVCSSNDAFCQDLSGGTLSNDCRLGVCDPSSTFLIGNPTGCDYTYNTANTDCINCASPTPQTVNCGNGVCEQGIGEDFASCSIDCRAPDFDSPAPLPTDDPTLNGACDFGGSIQFITFSGNIGGGGTCEDGDVCTTNVCDPQLPQCNVAPAVCDNTVIDFCCPDGCTPADDLDCLPPEVCEPTPLPTPTPIPTPPVTGLTLHGDGCSSLHAGVAFPSGGAWLLFAGAGFVGWFRLRRKSMR